MPAFGPNKYKSTESRRDAETVGVTQGVGSQTLVPAAVGQKGSLLAYDFRSVGVATFQLFSLNADGTVGPAITGVQSTDGTGATAEKTFTNPPGDFGQLFANARGQGIRLTVTVGTVQGFVNRVYRG